MARCFKPYLYICFILATLLQVYFLFTSEIILDSRLIIFVLLLLLNANHQVLIEKSSFSINFPLLFPVIVFYGPFWASLLASWAIIGHDELEDPRHIFLFNRGSFGLAAGASALVFQAMGGVENYVVALITSLFCYSAVNFSLFFLATALKAKTSGSLAFLWESVKTLLPSMALASLTYLAYVQYDIFGIIVAFYVFVTIRSGALFGHLEIRYRLSLIKSLLRAVYSKDPGLMKHLEKVAHYSKRLAKRSGYPRLKLQVLEEASYFHDIGKLEISDEILKKPGKLTSEEYLEMQRHPERGRAFIEDLPIPPGHKVIVENIACYHHERYDGTGYPHNLSGEDIPLEARIVAVADTWDAMVGQRCYRRPMPIADAIAELRRVKGQQLDPKLVELFVEIIEEDMAKQPQLSAEGLASSVSSSN